MAGPDLLRLYLDHRQLALEVSLYLIVPLLALGIFLWWRAADGKSLFHKYDVVSLNVQLGNVGNVTLKPNNEDIQIAHRIWTELMTRKAAQRIDIEHDVIIEIYNSWYALFGRVRQLISDIPGHLLRKEESTQKLVLIATQTLNEGLRPHLTRWNARFRHWYDNCPPKMKEDCPQDCQKQFPQYAELIADMMSVNEQLIQYANELEKIVKGSSK